MNLERLNELETIDPRPLPPWRAESFTEIEIQSDRETARERAENVQTTSDLVVYSDLYIDLIRSIIYKAAQYKARDIIRK
jgi:hypothetical protein